MELEAEFVFEEEEVFGGFSRFVERRIGEFVLEETFEGFLGFDFAVSRVELGVRDDFLRVDFLRKRVASRKDVVEVDDFKERLDTGTFGDFLLSHTTSNFERMSFNTSNNCMRIRTRLRTFLE